MEDDPMASIPIRDASAVLDQNSPHGFGSTEGEQFAHLGSWSVALPSWTWQASPGTFRILGLDPADVADVGAALMDAIVPEDRERVDRDMQEDLAHPRAFERAFRITRADGQIRELRLTGRVQGDDTGEPRQVTGLIQDVTEDAMLRKAWQTILRATNVLVHATEEEALIRDICDALVEAGGYRLAWYARYDRSADPPLRCIARAGHDDGYIDRAVLARDRAILDADPSTRAIVSGAQFVVSDMTTDDAFAPWREPAMQRGYRSLIVLPVRVRDAIDGAWLVYSGFSAAFDGGGHPLLLSLADQIGYGMGRLRDARTISQTLLATVDMLSSVLEVRDPYTGGHQRSVSEVATAIGMELDLPTDQLQGLRLGSAIHDLGKVAVPAELLSKPGRMLEEEMDLIRTHVTRGFDIVSAYAWPWPIPQMVRDHHERLDGSGYPYGKRGEEISLEARIIAVADTYEAMSHHRPYRAALGHERATEVIVAGRDRTYDADVVDAFLRVIDAGFTFDTAVTSTLGLPGVSTPVTPTS